MLCEQLSIGMKTGDTFVWPLAFSQGTSPDVPIDITGYAITLVVKGSTGATLASLAVDDGITVTDPANGLAVARVENTTNWTGTVRVQIETVDAGGAKLTYDPVVIGMQAPI